MATGRTECRTDGANQYKAQRQRGDGVDCIARQTYRQTALYRFINMYSCIHVCRIQFGERAAEQCEKFLTHICISRSTMNSIKRDKLLVQIKQLPSRAELSRARCEIDALPRRYHRGSCSIKCKRRRCAPSSEAIVISLSPN